MFASWIILAALLNWDLKKRGSKKAIPKTVVAFTLAIFLAIGLSNFLLAVWPNYKDPSLDIQKAKQPISHLTYKDLLISSSFDWTSYVTYFCPECHVVNVLGIAQKYSRKEEKRVLGVLLRQIRKSYSRGGKVYVVEYMRIPESPIWKNWITPYTGITPNYLALFEKRRAWNIENETVWGLKQCESCISSSFTP